MLSILALSILACDTGCPSGQSCQATTPPSTKPATVDLAAVDAYMQKDFWGNADGGIGPDLGAGGTEVHDGIYTVVSRRSDNQYNAVGFVIARDGTANVSGAVAPPADNEETWCASRGFSWPQFLAGGTNPPTVSWAILPMVDSEPAQAKCNGAPIRLQGTFDPANGNEYPLDTSPTKAGVKRLLVESCMPGTGPADCPATADGIPDVSGNRALTLRPGVYSLVSSGLVEPTTPGPDTNISGSATLFVRPAADATKPWTVETYCYDDNFRWPRVFSNLIPGAQPGVAFWDAEFTVTPKVSGAGAPEMAPAVVTCPAAQPIRADYCFTTDSAVPCPH